MDTVRRASVMDEPFPFEERGISVVTSLLSDISEEEDDDGYKESWCGYDTDDSHPPASLTVSTFTPPSSTNKGRESTSVSTQTLRRRKTRTRNKEHFGMPWMTSNSPLAETQKMQTARRSTDSHMMQSKERGFVMDAVITAVNASLPGQSVIPPYNAVRDKYAMSYFQSPTVRAMMERNERLRDLKNERNKLSRRRRCKATPSSDELKQRREAFVVDAVKTEHKRSKFFDIIPPYEANVDRNCKRYFEQTHVKKLMRATLTPRS